MKPTPEEIVDYLKRYHQDEYGNVLLNAHYFPLFVMWVNGEAAPPIGASRN